MWSNFSVLSVTDIAPQKNPKSSWPLRKLNTVHQSHSAGLNHLCCQSNCECMTPWPWSLIINCHTTGPHLPLTLYRPTDNLYLSQNSKSHSAAVWPFPKPHPQSVIRQYNQARPHNWLTVSVYSPFCPLCLVPPADLALQPIPVERTGIIMNLVLHMCAFGSTRRDYDLFLVKKKIKIKDYADRCLCHMFSADLQQ